MRQNDPFFLVEDSLTDRFDEIEHSDYLMHFSLFKSKSKYKGGFKKGKNTKEYNHDYYIHNKDKWKKEGMTEDELKELGFTDEEIAAFEFERDAKGALIVPTSWVKDFLENGASAASNLINKFKDTFLSLIGKKQDDEKPLVDEQGREQQGPKSPFVSDPKTIDDPQNLPVYQTEFEDPSGRETITQNLDFDYVDYYEGFAIKDKPMSIVEDAAAVNPHYGEGIGYSQNCGWCSYTYDLRRRGYDVQAPYDYDGLSNADIASFYKDTKPSDFKPIETPGYNKDAPPWSDGYDESVALFDSLKKEGDGARGIVTVFWAAGGGHAMAWEVVNGEAYVIDSQTNDVMNVNQFYEKRGKKVRWHNLLLDEKPEDEYSEDVQAYFHGCSYLRTDNRELNTTGKQTIHLIDYNEETKKYDSKEMAEYYKDLSQHIVSYEHSDKSKQIWEELNKYKRHKVKRKTKTRRKRAEY